MTFLFEDDMKTGEEEVMPAEESTEEAAPEMPTDGEGGEEGGVAPAEGGEGKESAM
ncbi:MAG: hypothetical protein AAGA35_01525 [Patescibacteria group bacterium]